MKLPTPPTKLTPSVACTNCKLACKKCSEARPCERCDKLGLGDSCLDAPRKVDRRTEAKLKKIAKGIYLLFARWHA